MVSLDVHVPPEVVEEKVVVLPTQIEGLFSFIEIDDKPFTVPVKAIFCVVAPVDVIAKFPLGLPVAEASNRT